MIEKLGMALTLAHYSPDVNKAYSSGVDAFALNIGTASWELDQSVSLYGILRSPQTDTRRLS
jgi:hypothetical protein